MNRMQNEVHKFPFMTMATFEFIQNQEMSVAQSSQVSLIMLGYRMVETCPEHFQKWVPCRVDG